MPKRKRDGSEEGAQPDIALGAREQRVLFKFQQAKVKLGHAFKVAKGFERQKLGRRMKTATAESKDEDVTRIEAEIVALKALDNAACAHHHLCKSLLKFKAVAESPRLPTLLRRPAVLSSDPAALNVHGRLCNSNPVKDALPGCMADVQEAMGIKVEPVGKKKRLRAKDFAESTEKKNGSADAESEQDNPPDTRERHEEDNDSSDEFHAFDDRIASSDNASDDDGDFGDEDSDADVLALERQLALEGIDPHPHPQSRPKYDPLKDLSINSDEDLQIDSDDQSSSPAPTKTASSRPTPFKASAFLPSLSGGGYISGSDSDFDDLDPLDIAPRKNRPGQRARQQIWEKKYGAGAKHLQKTDRGDGWDLKRGATEGNGRGGRGGRRGASKTAGFGRRGVEGGSIADGRKTVSQEAPPAVKKHRDDKGPIHPSWEAAKRAKEKREAPVVFQGKKVTFD